MEFKQFKKILSAQIAQMIDGASFLFTTGVDKDALWNAYLGSFPAEYNKIFRERGEHDCSACRQFIKNFGGVVAIKDNKLVSMWDIEIDGAEYKPLVEAMRNLVKSQAISDIYLTPQAKIGIDANFEAMPDGAVRTWEHLATELPKRFVETNKDKIPTLLAAKRDVKNVFRRSLEEITQESVATVIELIAQKSLYKGEEWQSVLIQFAAIQTEYSKLSADEKDNYCWTKSIEVGPVIGKIRNHSIGTLLINISENMDLNEAVKKYEAIVAPTNYKRPKAIFTQKMIEEAKKQLESDGLIDSLGRRHATLDDITVNNILFHNKDAAKRVKGSVFDEMKNETAENVKSFDKAEEIDIESFAKDVLPGLTSVELLMESKHVSNLVSLIAPENVDAPTLFKWDNPFSWAYNGNITDSMKERVKAAGGCVDGVLRFSIQWNEDGDNQNDFDAHCLQPDGLLIHYPRKGHRQSSTGMLDVDIVSPGNNIAVENINFLDGNAMPEGDYEFYVHTFSYRGGKSGFRAQVEFDGQIFEFDHNQDSKSYEKVIVAVVNYTKVGGFKLVKSLDHKSSSRQIWSVQTNKFMPVSVLMFSPNYWNEQNGIGHKHYFFMLNGCKNDTAPNGFFNEFLREEFMKHKRVFEALGSKMSVVPAEDQLSGLGFSSTQRNSIVCKVSGKFTRILKIKF